MFENDRFPDPPVGVWARAGGPRFPLASARDVWHPQKYDKLVGFSCVKSNQYSKLLRGRMQIGYARVSTRDQQLALQVDALQQAGCTTIYEEVLSGATVERPVLQDLLTQLRAGDVLMIWKLDRLGRSLRHLIEVVTTLRSGGWAFRVSKSISIPPPAVGN